jgi:hypothetical protein
MSRIQQLSIKGTVNYFFFVYPIDMDYYLIRFPRDQSNKFSVEASTRNISQSLQLLFIPSLMRGFRRDSGYYSCSSCANCVLCNSRLYYSAAGTSNCRDNNIDYCSGRGSMAVCKIPFTLAKNFVSQ